MTLCAVRSGKLQIAAVVLVGLFSCRSATAQSTAGAVTTTEAVGDTTRLSFTFGTKEDTVWYGFIGLSVVALLFDVVLTVVFILKTLYRPTKIFKPKPAPTNAATKTERFTNGAQNESPKRLKDHGVICDVSDLGSVSESNSEDSNEEIRGRGKYYRNVESIHVPVDEHQVHNMVSDRLGIELVEVRTDKDAKNAPGEDDDDDQGQGEEEQDEDDRATPPPPPIDDDPVGGAPPAHVNSPSKSPQRNALSVQAGTPVQMDIPYERVTCGRRIGKGGVGSVYAGELEGVGPVALKKVSVVGEERLQNLAQEAKMMAALRHPHIVFLYGLTISPEEEEDTSLARHNDRCAYLVMELCSGDVGSLIDNSPKVKAAAAGGGDGDGASGSSGEWFEYIPHRVRLWVQLLSIESHSVLLVLLPGDFYSADRIAIMQKIAQQVAETMEFVHSKHVIHRDLKPVSHRVPPCALTSVLLCSPFFGWAFADVMCYVVAAGAIFRRTFYSRKIMTFALRISDSARRCQASNIITRWKSVHLRIWRPNSSSASKKSKTTLQSQLLRCQRPLMCTPLASCCGRCSWIFTLTRISGHSRQSIK